MTDLQALKALREKVAAGTAKRQDFIDAGFTVHQSIFGLDAMTGGIRALGSAVALLEAVKPEWSWIIGSDGEAEITEKDASITGYCKCFVVTVEESPARALVLATIGALIEEAEDE